MVTTWKGKIGKRKLPANDGDSGRRQGALQHTLRAYGLYWYQRRMIIFEKTVVVSDGIPCCHIFCALKQLHVDTIPSSLICKRWTKSVKGMDNNFQYGVHDKNEPSLIPIQCSVKSVNKNRENGVSGNVKVDDTHGAVLPSGSAQLNTTFTSLLQNLHELGNIVGLPIMMHSKDSVVAKAYIFYLILVLLEDKDDIEEAGLSPTPTTESATPNPA
ncbi:hypothetical protein VNO77_18695 [Canavalia gladiata]|uniref:Protein FAR1-RELATED SEQUENCE n=1 Tax=Canavalia gladiata TaxID=3824 RepID=A0AAN9LLZ8_CANGL